MNEKTDWYDVAINFCYLVSAIGFTIVAVHKIFSPTQVEVKVKKEH